MNGRRGTMGAGRTARATAVPRRVDVALARVALAEDRWRADRTSRRVVAPSLTARAVVEAQAFGIVSGLGFATAVARAGGLTVRLVRRDGDRVGPGTPVLLLEGPARSILAVERTLLNGLMHASGIATLTARFVERARAVRPAFEIWATRKTLPGLRDLEKAAVVHGGGRPHRRDLAEALLLKTNHLALVPLARAVARARRARRPRERVEVEVRSPAEALEAVRAGADALLLDNTPPRTARRIVDALRRAGVRDRLWIEVSGGVDLSNIAAYARSGADAASVGRLTHSAPSLPFHLVLRRSRSPRR